MTTRSQLKLHAAPWLTPELRSRGFELTPRSFGYMRRAGEIWHFLLPEFTADQTQVSFEVTAWVPELALQPYDLDRLPEEVSLVAGGRLGAGRLGAPMSSFLRQPRRSAKRLFPVCCS